MGKVHAYAICHTCGWECSSKNADGLGVQHAKRNKHEVVIEIGIAYKYKGDERIF